MNRRGGKDYKSGDIVEGENILREEIEQREKRF
jgi:hypothetical protein